MRTRDSDDAENLPAVGNTLQAADQFRAVFA